MIDRWYHAVRYAGLAIIPILSACTKDLPTGSRVTAPPARAMTPTSGRPAEADFRRISAAIPSFGGFFLDAEGNFTAYTTDMSSADAIRTELTKIRDKRRMTNSLRVIQGEFNFAQLSTWRDLLLRMGMPAIPEFHAIAIDKAENKVFMRVTSEQGIQRLVALAGANGIPERALSFQIGPRERDFTDLSDAVYPPGGGLKINGYDNNNNWVSDCSLGFNTFGGASFVTNSHCTAVRGYEANPTVMYQPTPSGNYLGYEADDPAYFGGSTDWNCPYLQPRCRYSDAARFSYGTSVSTQGIIERTTSAQSTSAGSTTINGTLTIVDEVDYPIQNQTLHKIGQGSGWTYGNVSYTCVDVGSGWYVYLCQDQVAGYATGGDSGAPVFVYSVTEVTLYGIVRGGTSSYFTFSNLGNIWAELGYLPTYQY